jgi:hypothetical protein
MPRTRRPILAVVFVALAAQLILLVATRDHYVLRATSQLRRFDADRQKLRDSIDAQEKSLIELRAKLSEAERDNTELLSAVDETSKVLPKLSAPPRAARITHAEVESRYKRARELARAGRADFPIP